MKVRTLVEVNERQRLVIAKFFGAAAPEGSRDAVRTRATRKQVKRFVAHAVEVAVAEHTQVLRGRARAAAARLALPAGTEPEQLPLPEPKEKQLNLY